MKAIRFDATNYAGLHNPTTRNCSGELAFMERVARFNKRQAQLSMAATIRWADKLAQGGKKVLPRANWWHGDPFGSAPATPRSWATRVAAKNPPHTFRYTPGTRDMSSELAKLGAYKKGE